MGINPHCGVMVVFINRHWIDGGYLFHGFKRGVPIMGEHIQYQLQNCICVQLVYANKFSSTRLKNNNQCLPQSEKLRGNTPIFEMPRSLKSKIFNILPPNVLDSFFEGSQLVRIYTEFHSQRNSLFKL